MFNIFKKNRILCPYCLGDIPYDSSTKYCINPKCKYEVPVLYGQKFKQHPPLFIQVIGWSRVGKTVFLQALTYLFEDLNIIWKNYRYAPDTDPTLNFLKDVRDARADGRLPAPTTMGMKDAYIMLLSDMPRWGSRSIVVRDCAGETFQEIDFDIEYLPYLLHVPTTFFVISLSDIKKSDRFDDLLTSYIRSMSKNNVDFKKQKKNIIVILSKADQLSDELPPKVMNYLSNDPILDAIQSQDTNSSFGYDRMSKYMNEMEEISVEIENFLQKRSSGIGFIRNAQAENIKLKFCAVSSLGAKPNPDNTLDMGWQPRRVLDPFLWALEFQSK